MVLQRLRSLLGGKEEDGMSMETPSTPPSTPTLQTIPFTTLNYTEDELRSRLTLITHDDYKALAHELNNFQDYRPLYKETNISMYYKIQNSPTDQLSPNQRFKYFGRLNYPIHTVLSVLRDDETRHEWDTHTIGRKDIFHFTVKDESTEPRQSITTIRKKGRWMIKDREFISLQSIRYLKKGSKIRIEMISRALSDDTLVPPREEFIRGRFIFFGMRLEADENSADHTKYSVVTQVDMGGIVPASVVNLAARFLPKEFEQNVSKGCELRISKNAQDDYSWIEKDALLRGMGPLEALRQE